MRYEGYEAGIGKWNMHTFVWEIGTERPLERPRHRRVENIKTGQETGWKTWIGMIWLRTETCGRLLQSWWNFRLDKMWRVCWLANELLHPQEELYCMELSSQSVSWLTIISYLFLFLVFTEEVQFFCTNKHRTLTMLSSIMQNISSSVCNTILELWLPGAAESSVSVTKWLTKTWHSSRLLLGVSERKHTDHIHVIKHATLHRKWWKMYTWN